MEKVIRVALGQILATRDKRRNLDKIQTMSMSAAAAGAQLVVFPEGAMIHFGEPGESLVSGAETLEGEFVTTLSEIAAGSRIAIVCGMFEPADTMRVYNTVVALDGEGRLTGSYRKIHLYDAFGYKESDKVRPGDGEVLTFPLAGLTVGVMTCYDLRFPELARHLVDQGADVIALPAAWVDGPLKAEHWEILVRARAIENTVYVLAADQVKEMNTGSSLVVDPLGVVRARGGEEEELVVADLDPDRIAQARAKVPSLRHRRFRVSFEQTAEVAR